MPVGVGVGFEAPVEGGSAVVGVTVCVRGAVGVGVNVDAAVEAGGAVEVCVTAGEFTVWAVGGAGSSSAPH